MKRLKKLFGFMPTVIIFFVGVVVDKNLLQFAGVLGTVGYFCHLCISTTDKYGNK